MSHSKDLRVPVCLAGNGQVKYDSYRRPLQKNISLSLLLMSRGFNWNHPWVFLSNGTTVHGAEPAPHVSIISLVVRIRLECLFSKKLFMHA